MPTSAADRLASLNCGILTVDASRRMHDANAVLSTWTGRAAQDLEGQDLGTLVARGSMVYWETTVEPLLVQQGFAWDVLLELKTDRDTRAAVLVNARREGGLTECLFFPFSDRRRYENQKLAAQVHARQHRAELARLAELNRFRRDFVNSAAHELATPMTPLQIQFHLLKNSLQGNVDPKTRRALDAMQTNLEKLAKFTSSLMASASIDAGRIGMSFEAVDLAVMVPKMVERWRARVAPHREINVEVEPAVIDADLKALRSCVRNLLDNAAKFSQPETPIEVRVVAGPPAQITVEDHGRGIDPARLPELGRPFVQVHDPKEVTVLGAGLGLHIVTGLMKAQGGMLRVESEGHGKGTIATLQFPVAADAAVGPPELEAQVRPEA